MKDDDLVKPPPEHLRHQQRGNRVLDGQRYTVNNKTKYTYKTNEVKT